MLGRKPSLIVLLGFTVFLLSFLDYHHCILTCALKVTVVYGPVLVAWSFGPIFKKDNSRDFVLSSI